MAVTIHLRDGSRIESPGEIGGGQMLEEIGSLDAYECHFDDPKSDGLIIIPQSRIEKVIDNASGAEVPFGNPAFPGHPDYGTPETLTAQIMEGLHWFDWAIPHLKDNLESGDLRDMVSIVKAGLTTLRSMLTDVRTLGGDELEAWEADGAAFPGATEG